MIAPVIVKTAIAVGAIGEVATLVIAQATETVDRTAVWLAGIGFAGLLVTSVLTLVLQRVAANDQRIAREEQRQDARELRDATLATKSTIDKVEVLVNSKSDVKDATIKDLADQIKVLNASALAKAEAAPAIGEAAAAVPAPDTTPNKSE